MAGNPLSSSFNRNRALADEGVWTPIVNLSLSNFRTNANPPAVLTGATSPKYVLSSNQQYINWDATVQTGMVYSFQMPPNLASKVRSGTSVGTAVKFLLNVMQIAGSGSPEACTVTVRPYATAIDGTAKSWAARAATLLSLPSTSKASQYSVDFTGIRDAGGYDFAIGDSVNLLVAVTGNTTNDAIRLYGGVVLARCNDVLTSETARA